MDTPEAPTIGRPEHEPSPTQRAEVRLYAKIGLPQKMIVQLVAGIGSDHTLRKHYELELAGGEAEGTAQIAGKLFSRAMAGDLGAMIFWLKARAGWREKHVLDDPEKKKSIADLVLASMAINLASPTTESYLPQPGDVPGLPAPTEPLH